MSGFLATQSMWLIPTLAGLLVIALGLIVWLALRGRSSSDVSQASLDDAFEDYV